MEFNPFKSAPLKEYLSLNTIFAGVIAGLLPITGASLLIIEAVLDGGYGNLVLMSWMFSVHFF